MNATLKTWTPAVPRKIPDNIVSSSYTTTRAFVPSYEKYEYLSYLGHEWGSEEKIGSQFKITFYLKIKQYTFMSCNVEELIKFFEFSEVIFFFIILKF